MVYVDIKDASIAPIARTAFPNYNGKTCKVDNFRPMRVNSYWDGGSKDEFALIDLATKQQWRIPTSHPHFDRQPNGSAVGILECNELPPNCALVRHSIFCGKDAGLTIFVRPDNLAPLLPMKVELTDDEQRVLVCTRSYKSSYAGISDYRFKQSKMTPESWEAAKSSLICKKLLNKAGAITDAGRNAISDVKW